MNRENSGETSPKQWNYPDEEAANPEAGGALFT